MVKLELLDYEDTSPIEVVSTYKLRDFEVKYEGESYHVRISVSELKKLITEASSTKTGCRKLGPVTVQKLASKSASLGE